MKLSLIGIRWSVCVCVGGGMVGGGRLSRKGWGHSGEVGVNQNRRKPGVIAQPLTLYPPPLAPTTMKAGAWTGRQGSAQ